MFLPLEECDPLVGAVVVGQDHADQFPRLQAQTGGDRFKFLRSPGLFHAVLPLRNRHGLDVEREALGLRAIAGSGRSKVAGDGCQFDVESTSGCCGQSGKQNRGGAGVSGGNLGNYAGRQAGEAEFKTGSLVNGNMDGKRRRAALGDCHNGGIYGYNKIRVRLGGQAGRKRSDKQQQYG